MNEFLILLILKNKSSNIYEIKKYIDKTFAPFLSISLGALIPALKRLESKEAVLAEKEMTDGGLKRTVYSFLENGEAIINSYLIENINSAPQLVRREVEVLLILTENNILSDEQNILLLQKIKNALFDNLKLLEKTLKFTKTNAEFLQLEIDYTNAKLNYVNEKILQVPDTE